MTQEPEKHYTVQGVRDGMERWAQLIEGFLGSGEDVRVLDVDDYGGGDSALLAGMLSAISNRAGLEDELEIIDHGSRVLIIRRSCGDSLWLVRVALHRGFTKLLIDLDPRSDDPDQLKRNLERAVEQLGEQNRIKVRLDKPTQVSLNLKGGHRLPRSIPKKAGLSKWAEPLDEFLFSEPGCEDLLVEPGETGLEEAAELLRATIKLMELDDMLVVDSEDGRILVRRTRNLESDAEEESVPAKKQVTPPEAAGSSSVDRSVDAYIARFLQDFDAGDADLTRFPLRRFAEDLFGGERRQKLREVDGRFGGFDRMIAQMLQTSIARQGLTDRVRIDLHDDWDLRLKRPSALRSNKPQRPLDTPMENRRFSAGQSESVDEFVRGFWWGLLDSGNESTRFPMEEYVKWVYLEAWDTRPEWSNDVGGMDWTLHQILVQTISDWDRSKRFVVRYYGRGDVRAELTDGALERRWAAGAISSLLHDYASDGSNAIETVCKADASQPELLEYELWREIEERGMEDRFEVEVLDGKRLRTVYQPKVTKAVAISGSELDEVQSEEELLVGFLRGDATEMRLYYAGAGEEEVLHQMGRFAAAAFNLGSIDLFGISSNREGYVSVTRK